MAVVENVFTVTKTSLAAIVAFKLGHFFTKLTGNAEWLIGVEERSVNTKFQPYRLLMITELREATLPDLGWMLRLTKSGLHRNPGPLAKLDFPY